MRIHLIPFLPEMDGGHYTFLAQSIYHSLSMGQNISSDMPFSLYASITSWVYGLEINQWMALR